MSSELTHSLCLPLLPRRTWKLSTLQDDFGYEFSKANFAEDPTFNKFIASASFKKWLHE